MTEVTKKTTAKKTDKKVVDSPILVKPQDNKRVIIQKHQSHAKDNGSAQVQIAILSERITYLTGHLKKHPKDDHSRRGLLMMVGKRRKLLNFLKGKSKDQFIKLVKSLGLRY